MTGPSHTMRWSSSNGESFLGGPIVNRKLVVLTLLLAFTACRQKQSAQESQQGTLDAVKTQEEGYTLRIVFRGLAAFAEEKDSGRVWAFLVDADYEKDPRDQQGLPPAESLPPGVLDEIRNGISDFHNYPSHFSRLRLTNADVIAGPTPDPQFGLPIEGGDITFKNNPNPPPNDKPEIAPLPNLCELSEASKIFAARPELKEDEQVRQRIVALDLLDPQMLAISGAIDKRLAARVRLETGKITAGPVYCKGGRKGYSFKIAAKAPIGLQCPGVTENAVRLAEEVQVEQEKVKVPTVIDLGSTIGASITIKPHNPDKPVVVEILNQTQVAIEGEQCLEERHPQVFRWFYRLASPQAQLYIPIHLFPCEKTGTKGDPKCPLKKMFIPGTEG
jgi:hypothetical protein